MSHTLHAFEVCPVVYELWREEKKGGHFKKFSDLKANTYINKCNRGSELNMLSLEANYNIGRFLFSVAPDGNSSHMLCISHRLQMSGNTSRKAI